MSTVSREEAKRLLELGDDELYPLLVPEQARGQVYSKDGLLARGRSIFVARVNDVRTVVCGQYSRRGSTVKNSIDLTVLLATAILSAPTLLGIPALPMAALLVKIGLEEFCLETDEKGDTRGGQERGELGEGRR
jgi:hypothetical protein